MTTAPKYIRVRGELYKLASSEDKKHRLKRPLYKLLERWLDAGWRKLINSKQYRSWDDKALAEKMADEFGVYIADLVHDPDLFDWPDQINKIRSLRQ